MSADLVMRLATLYNDPDGNLQLRYANTVNTPISSVVWDNNGAAVADDYTLVFTKSGTVTCTVDCNIKNPWRNMTGVTVVADGATVNHEIIPGIGIVISSSVDTGWTAKVTIGDSMTDAGVITSVLVFGVVEVATYTTGVRCCVTNVGDAPAQNCKLYSLPGYHYTDEYDDPLIEYILPHSSTSRHKMATAESRTITFQDWKDAGGGKKSADVYVNGTKAIEDAVFNGTTVYEHGSANGYVDAQDKFLGQRIVLADTTDDPTSASLTEIVVDGYLWVEFAPDVSGSPGTYANQDLTLTQPGQSSGVINASGAAYFWVRFNLPAWVTPGAMRKALIMARGLTT